MHIYNIQFAATPDDFDDTMYGLYDGGPGVWRLDDGLGGKDASFTHQMRAFGRKILHENARYPDSMDRAYCVYVLTSTTGVGVWEKANVEGTIKSKAEQ